MSGAASYWQEREEAKAAALKMAAGLSARERGLAVTAAKRGLVDEVRRDASRQRRFERGFVPLDAPDANGGMYDYGDCGREMKRMMRGIDAPFWERVHEMRFAAALGALAGHRELKRTLRAIRRHRERGKIAAALGLPESVYAKRFARSCEILGIAP